MGASEALKQILKEKKERDARSASTTDWEARKTERIKAINTLHADIKRWLTPSIKDGIAALSTEDCELHDSRLGAYKTKALVLQVGNSKVSFRPVAGNVAGALARVDITSGARSITLVYLPGRPRWSILRRGHNVQTLPLTEESFVDMLTDLLDE